MNRGYGRPTRAHWAQAVNWLRQQRGSRPTCRQRPCGLAIGDNAHEHISDRVARSSLGRSVRPPAALQPHLSPHAQSTHGCEEHQGCCDGQRLEARRISPPPTKSAQSSPRRYIETYATCKQEQAWGSGRASNARHSRTYLTQVAALHDVNSQWMPHTVNCR